jgi:8-oxo-dGTP pyrophosphatase MutT (NUDIX family)
MKREFSAGGIVFKKNQNPSSKIQIEWLLSKSSASDLFPNSIWRLPKGWIDDFDGGKSPGPIASGERKATEEELQTAALREVREEAGVEAKIIEKLGTEIYFITIKEEKIMKFVTFYLMEWVSDLPEGFGFETSEVQWLPFDEAKKLLKSGGEKKILEKASMNLIPLNALL